MIRKSLAGRKMPPKSYDVLDRELVTKCFEGECTMCLDTCVGSFSLLTPDGTVAAKLNVPELAKESSLHFCASMHSGQAVTILGAEAALSTEPTRGYQVPPTEAAPEM